MLKKIIILVQVSLLVLSFPLSVMAEEETVPVPFVAVEVAPEAPAVPAVVVPVNDPIVIDAPVVVPVVSDSSVVPAGDVTSTVVVDPVISAPILPDVFQTPIVSTIETKTISSVLEALPVKKQIVKSYSEFMRSMQAVRAKKDDTKRNEVVSEFSVFLQSEKDKLDKLDVSWLKQRQYLNRLQKTYNVIDPQELGFFTKLWQNSREFIGLDKDGVVFEEDKPRTVSKPEKPAEFKFNNDEIKINRIDKTKIQPQSGQDIQPLLDTLKDVITIQPASAEGTNPQMPVIDDIKASGEVEINSEIVALANELHSNPVEIFNYVRTNIVYEPYFGAKKGSVGCLHEKLCNDTDASSLTIAILRAASIPARYKKSIAVFSTAQLRNLLGIDNNNAVYAAFFSNKVPVYTISGNPLPALLDQADLTNENYLALEWTFVQAYDEYDQRGANINNTLVFNTASSTADLQAQLSVYPKKQWISFDTIIKSYTKTNKEIVHDTASFNTENFFYSFLQYQGGLSPVDKYVSDLKTQTGKDIATTNYQSTLTPDAKPYDIIPPTLPYVLGTGEVSNGLVILPETWSTLPDARRHVVSISLVKQGSNDVVLQHTYFSSEINNVPLTLNYKGNTTADQTVIDSYGGIYATPAELVDLKAVLESDNSVIDGTTPVAIGESLVLKFDYSFNNQSVYSDEKFSVAGNEEGIYIVTSHVIDNSGIASDDPDRNSKLLLEGNSALAREYLRKIEEKGTILEKSLDYTVNTGYSRAVVTQNRVLNKVNNTPTTFDFKGLSMDASTYITDYSNRGNYKTYRKDFRLLWGLEASYYEGQLFNDVAGLTGISTVKGLQYAYAHPADYTVQTITSSTESVIDTLDLSDNTKTNMHADVQAGNTIITPNKYVVDGSWNGILYISLTPYWTGTYAIGEQVSQNGGWTTNRYTLIDWNDEDNRHQNVFEYDNGPQKFIYKDDPDKNILCSISVTTYNQIVGGNIAPGWSLIKYGKPCMNDTAKGPYLFGTHDHSFIIATGGAYFKSQSDNYDYWMKDTDVVSLFKQKLPSEKLSIGKLVPYYGTYRYNGPTFWSYTQALFSPAKKQVYGLQKNVGLRYFSSSKLLGSYLPGLLGFPLMDEDIAAPYSPKNSTGIYQQFTNGTVYKNNTDILHLSLVVFGPLDQKMAQAGGTGAVGFPLSDPKESNGYRYQLLQSNNDISWKLSNGSSAITPHIPYNCSFFGDYADHWYDAPKMVFVHLHGILDSGISLLDSVEILAKSSLEFAFYHPELVLDVSGSKKINYLSGLVTVVNFNKIVTFFRNAPTQVSQFFITEYDASFGKKGCAARQWYIEGRLGGEFLQMYLPAKAITLESKLNVLSKVDDFRYGSQLTDLTEASAETFAGLAKSGQFKNKAVWSVAQKYIDSGEAFWYTKPLECPYPKMIDLSKAISSGYLKGDLQYSFYSLSKAITDDYLYQLSKQGDEIIFVLKQDGSLVFTPRGGGSSNISWKIPHPVLSGNEPVRSAGTIKFIDKSTIEIENASGHLTPTVSTLQDVSYAIRQGFPNIKVNIKPFVNK